MTTTIAPRSRHDHRSTPVPVAGLFDRIGNHGHLRVDGYLPGPRDVRVTTSLEHQLGLRKGDFIEGLMDAEAPAQGDGQRGRQRVLVRVERVNGVAPDRISRRPHFADLTPVHPTERLRMETSPTVLATRVIDLIAPIGKGTRGLIVAPPKAGKTMLLKAVAEAVARNHPNCHLMVVLLDERPEEVTDMRRSVRGEVVSSTFDRPAADHVSTAELAVEHGKRLVEQGREVVILLDSITRLCRAYNNSAAGKGRTLSGGVDAAALHGPKRLFGAARAIETGGSLTMLATALVETGSRADDHYFEELKGTGNMELRLSRALADSRTFPAVDISLSGTRREEILLAADELAALRRLRRVLGARDAHQSAELLLDHLRRTAGNAEFIQHINQNAAPNGR
ncbi:transcription termination factor Rho [Streptantibioticus rubrisoli]|uniref:Transcription termination factor Rho n=1 Tax=Streptantibioticus rubrisoli TaxID=1387313 RepID=A0ABT1P725_9ACTN|nr:transcription termination factor Rho [Streptantibioticus rubrisoli]MCQ4041172.1 transcription termination factor Rho [Streptantibioticus rubrisoli]